jgi:pyridoxal phosphate enzyme (YggS family)
MQEKADIIARNVARVREQIAAAAARAGRNADDVTLVAVTKYADIEATQLIIQAGCRDIGESRPQELWQKAKSLATLQQQTGFRWHMIGHLQRNKVARTLPLTALVHSVDTARLLAAINNAATETRPRALFEINISGDASKHGWRTDDMLDVIDGLSAYPNVEIIGLMTMASLSGDVERARRDFSALRELRDQLQPSCPPHCRLSELSMGMSRDFAAAIEEGATMVRVGSALFEGVS